MNLNNIHSVCKDIIKSEMFDEYHIGASLACKMYDKMTSSDNCENCIGENFNQHLHRLIDNWFGLPSPGNIDYYFNTYCIHLYLFFERIEFVFKVLNKDGKSKLFNDFYYHNFQSMKTISKWANFIKHPKEFLFTHWPTYYFEGMNVEKNKEDITINTAFVISHYSSSNSSSPTILENSAKVFVELPNLEKLTKGFCDDLNCFIDFICENKVVFEFLMKKSTIEDYYKKEVLGLN